MRVCRSHALGLVLVALALAALAGSAVAPFDLGASRAVAQTAAPAGDAQWQALGARTYDTYCSGCHQRSGRGNCGRVPAAGRPRPPGARAEGRRYLTRVVLFGLAGAIEVEGTKYNGVMPGLVFAER